jgi:hypothetical protein
MTVNNTVKNVLRGGGGGSGGSGGGGSGGTSTSRDHVMQLSMARVRDELKKKGRGTFGNKCTLQVHLKEGITLNVPVAAELRLGVGFGTGSHPPPTCQ